MCADRSIGNSEGDAFLVDGRRTWMGSVSFVELLDGMGRLGVVDDWPCGIRWVFGITEDGSAGMLK